MIGPKKMIALWNSHDNMKISEFLILDISAQNRQTDRLHASSGSSDAGWMEGNPLDTPHGLYSFLATAYGFETREIAFKVLKEFEKVEGQGWARELRYRAGDPELDNN